VSALIANPVGARRTERRCQRTGRRGQGSHAVFVSQPKASPKLSPRRRVRWHWPAG